MANSGIALVGCGSAVPAARVSNEHLCERVETSDDWIVERTGIRARHFIADGVYASDLALGGLPNTITDNAFKHQLDTHKLGIARKQSVFEGVPTNHHWRPTDRTTGKQADTWIARSSQAKNALPNRYAPLQIRY